MLKLPADGPPPKQVCLLRHPCCFCCCRCLVITGMQSYEQIDRDAPFSVAFEKVSSRVARSQRLSSDGRLRTKATIAALVEPLVQALRVLQAYIAVACTPHPPFRLSILCPRRFAPAVPELSTMPYSQSGQCIHSAHGAIYLTHTGRGRMGGQGRICGCARGHCDSTAGIPPWPVAHLRHARPSAPPVSLAGKRAWTLVCCLRFPARQRLKGGSEGMLWT